MNRDTKQYFEDTTRAQLSIMKTTTTRQMFEAGICVSLHRSDFKIVDELIF
jgi:hypothetical protein